MNDGMQTLLSLPQNLQQKIVDRYGSLEEFYFEIFYNEYQKYGAHKANNTDLMNQLESQLSDIEDFLEGAGASDGRDITIAITSDYTEIVATRFAEDMWKKVGMSEEDIKELIKRYLGKK